MGGAERTGDAGQSTRPVALELIVHQALSKSEVPHPGKAVPNALEVGSSLSNQLTGQPFTSVHTDLDVEGEPRLEACVDETEDRVDEVLVDVQALAGTELQATFVAVLRTNVLEGHAGFQNREHADQPFIHRVRGQNLSREIFLALTRRTQVSDRPLQPLRLAQRPLLDPFCGLDSEHLEID